jgi:hypothetical protein
MYVALKLMSMKSCSTLHTIQIEIRAETAIDKYKLLASCMLPVLTNGQSSIIVSTNIRTSSEITSYHGYKRTPV